MKKISPILFSILLLMLLSCNTETKTMSDKSVDSFKITPALIEEISKELIGQFGNEATFRINKGVHQVASLWRTEDGNSADFKQFCIEHFVADADQLEKEFLKISRNLEILYGNFHKMAVGMKEPLHLIGDPITKLDEMFGAYSPSSHLTEDLYRNKIAFHVALNFPAYNLEEKAELSKDWNRLDWAYARAGDLYTARVPADLLQNAASSFTTSDSYISAYNIYMGKLVDENGAQLFPEDLKLISHWGLRDELKSNYNTDNGFQKQQMIYKVMKRIISQEIPKAVINQNTHTWNPATNQLFSDGKEITFEREMDERYQQLLNNFHVVRAMDKYYPQYPSYIKRAFSGNMELTQAEVEELFIEFVSSEQVKAVAGLIQARLGRDLEPFDIWYDGFKSRSNINEDELNKITQAKYPNPAAFQADLPNILKRLGFGADKAEFIASKIQVDPSRGAGHAWGAEMKDDKARLRTRVGANGMDYKGYNIAVHEFGHNVEQTISLQDVDYFMLQGVPNTAFTEAVAFLFQSKDLELLGMDKKNADSQYLNTLDNLWSSYEIMGVALVDMNVWKWLYNNPETTAAQLKEAVISISREIWNKYYAPVLGVDNAPILAIYSHMIDNPLYLSNYPVGHIIEFQVEKYLEGRELASELTRMLVNGRIIPQEWMKEAVGTKISIKPLLDDASQALKMVDNLI
jgi:hypothetical protein